MVAIHFSVLVEVRKKCVVEGTVRYTQSNENRQQQPCLLGTPENGLEDVSHLSPVPG